MTREGTLQSTSTTSPIYACLNYIEAPRCYPHIPPIPLTTLTFSLPGLLAFPFTVFGPSWAKFFLSTNLLLWIRNVVFAVSVLVISISHQVFDQKKLHQILWNRNVVFVFLCLTVLAITVRSQVLNLKKLN
jgi:hypothetical protein